MTKKAMQLLRMINSFSKRTSLDRRRMLLYTKGSNKEKHIGRRNNRAAGIPRPASMEWAVNRRSIPRCCRSCVYKKRKEKALSNIALYLNFDYSLFSFPLQGALSHGPFFSCVYRLIRSFFCNLFAGFVCFLWTISSQNNIMTIYDKWSQRKWKIISL